MHERDVASDELVRGWEVSKGHFVVVEDAELEAIEQRDTSRSIEIGRFVGLGEVDPVYFDRTYYLIPAGTEAARRPYVLLLAAMKDGDVAAHRALRPGRQGEAVPDPPARATRSRWRRCSFKRTCTITPRSTRPSAPPRCARPELELAKQIVASLAAPFDPAELHSEYRASLRSLLEAKVAGEEISMPGARRACADRRPDGGAASLGRGREEARSEACRC